MVLRSSAQSVMITSSYILTVNREDGQGFSRVPIWPSSCFYTEVPP